jgi:hypothetical protein
MIIVLILAIVISETLAQLKNTETEMGIGLITDELSDDYVKGLPALDVAVDPIILPEKWDNTEQNYFRPIFLQSNGSCAQASMIGYVFTYKVNRSNDEAADELIRQFPTHFSYNFVNGGDNGSSFSDAIIVASELGIPNSQIWQKTTGDPLAGSLEMWMSGYDDYYSALENKAGIPGFNSGGYRIENRSDESNEDALETLKTLKWYLASYPHFHEPDFGGVMSFAMVMQDLTYRNVNTEEGLVSLQISIHENVSTIPTHALTVVGWDDTIAHDFDEEYKRDFHLPGEDPLPPSNYEWDPNANGGVGGWATTPKPLDEWEVGALKIVNSWGDGWYNGKGFFYLPYRFLKYLCYPNSSYFIGLNVETKRKPTMTFKIKMQHHNRKNLRNTIGFSEKLLSQYPSSDIILNQIKTLSIPVNDSGELPMNGSNYNPIEFCFEVPEALIIPHKYFFIIDDLCSGEYASTIVPEGFIPKVLEFDLIDERYKKFIISCDESDVEIADIGTTDLSIIYDVFLQNEITSNTTFSYNIGLPYNVNITAGNTLTLADNTKLYFHDSGINNTAGDIIIEGKADFIGFDNTTNDYVNVGNAQLNIGNRLLLRNCDLYLGESSVLVLKDNAEIIISEGSELVVSPNAAITYGNGSKIKIEKGGKLTLLDNTILSVINQSNIEIVDSESNIDYNLNTAIQISDNSKFIIGENTIYEAIIGTQINIAAGSKLNLLEGSEFAIQDGSNVYFEPNSYIEATVDSKIALYENVIFNLESVIINGNDWFGIVAELGSSININNSYFNDCQTGVNAFKAVVSITNSTFSNCINGISLVNCNNYSITSNTFTGMATGTGVSLAVSDGIFRNNTVNNFTYGVRITSCSPQISNNVISNNKRFGIYVFGYNSNPQLVLSSKAQGINNSIINNGTNPPSSNPFFFSDAQIGIMPFGNVYLKDGMNNIHSGQPDTVPVISCISVSPYTYSPYPPPILIMPTELWIEAEGNYWGSKDVNYAFFDLRWDEYYIDYNPWYEYPLTGETVQPVLSSHEPPDVEFTILSNAMFLEEKENFTASIKQYEHIIDKYEDTPEYYVALARLPYVYLKAGIETEYLISTYDAGLESESITQKKFLKEMKIATHIKGKRYETAKTLAEEMKAEALTEDEIAISEIDIAICDVMMASGSKDGKSTADYMAKLNNLLSPSYGDEKTEPTGITENIIPSTTMLYQNFPNPFNPVTQIKFALTKTAEMKLSVYNISGQKVAELANGMRQAGVHSLDFDGNRFNSGIYYYTLEVEGKTLTQKMILMK